MDSKSFENNKDAVGAIQSVTAGKLTDHSLIQYYTQWAENYDQDLASVGYTGPQLAVEACCELFSLEQRQSVRILDVAAGTGLLGYGLHQNGFCNIDALDPSQGMLDTAREKTVYEKFFCEFITEKELPIEEDTYDCITCSGGFVNGHIPCEALYEMMRIIRPGGYIVITLREEYLRIVPEYKDKLEPLMDRIEAQGKWKKIKKEVLPGFALNKPGVLYEYKKL